jgi:hypothetical protein
MRKDEELTLELKEKTIAAMDAANVLCEALKDFRNIEVGETSEEEQDKYRAFCAAIDSNKQLVLKRILMEHGYLLFL